MQATAPEGYTDTATLLVLEAMRAGRNVPQIIRAFALPKTWRQAIAPENVVVDLTPRPLGRTADYVRALTTPVPSPTPAAVMPMPVVVDPQARPVMIRAIDAVRPADVSANVERNVVLQRPRRGLDPRRPDAITSRAIHPLVVCSFTDHSGTACWRAPSHGGRS